MLRWVDKCVFDPFMPYMGSRQTRVARKHQHFSAILSIPTSSSTPRHHYAELMMPISCMIALGMCVLIV